MRLEINKVTITGFKGYKDTVEYELGNRTIITGNNGLGKSSVGEAIAWCLTGCDIWGNEKAATRLVNDKKPKVTEVILDLNLEGEIKSIIRRKKGSTNEIYFDGKKCSTADIAREIYKSKDLFLSIVNPYYFPALAPKDSKALLSDVLKPVSKEEVFDELGDYLKEILLKNNFRVPETFLSDTRAEIKEQQENIVYLEGVNDGLKEIEVNQKREFDSTELDEAKEKLKEMNAKNNIEEQLSKLEKPSDISSALKALEVDEKLAKSKLENIVLTELIPVQRKKDKKQNLLEEYHEQKLKLDNLQHEIVQCNNCGTEIDLTKKIEENLKKEISDILERGKKLKIEIEEIEKKNKEIEEKNDVIRQQKTEEVEAELREINIKKLNISATYDKAMQEYIDKKNEILNNADNEEVKDQIQFLSNKVKLLEEERNDILNSNAEIDVAIKHNEKLAKERKANLEQIKNSENKISQLKLAIDAAKQYNSIKIKKQSEQIKPYLKDVEIQFEEMNKDGELKDKFKICYQGKDFNKLSNAEKIKAGLEIANLLMNVQDMYLPIFLDNSESITTIPELETQMIIAKVTEDNEIKVEVQE